MSRKVLLSKRTPKGVVIRKGHSAFITELMIYVTMVVILLLQM